MAVLTENVEILLPESGLELKLKQAKQENRKLVIKLGSDPAAPDLHPGHTIVLNKLVLITPLPIIWKVLLRPFMLFSGVYQADLHSSSDKACLQPWGMERQKSFFSGYKNIYKAPNRQAAELFLDEPEQKR